jgi:hypothetical protein
MKVWSRQIRTVCVGCRTCEVLQCTAALCGTSACVLGTYVLLTVRCAMYCCLMVLRSAVCLADLRC